MEDVLTKYKRLDPVNHRYFVDYLRYLQLRNIRETTITTKLWKIYGYLIWSDFRDAKTAQPQDLENFYLQRRKERSPITAFGDIQELALFFRWLLPDRELVKFKPQKPRVDVPPEKVLQSDNIRGILEYCESQRDRALVAVAWDSAARISELLDINIGHVNFDRYGAVISVSGKTGRRNIRLVSSGTGPSSLDQYPPSQRQPGRPALCHLPEAWEHVSIPAHRAPGAEHLCPAGRSCRLSKGHQSPRIPARASYNPGQAAYRVRAPGVCRMVQRIEHGPGLCASVQPGYRQ